MRALWESAAERMYEQLELSDWSGDCVDVGHFFGVDGAFVRVAMT
jgi:hypothetical protein